MLTLRYKKENSAIFISHIDLLKQLVKIINRAKIDVEYSKGFHPHMKIYFATPLPVGVSSDCEYITIFCKEESIIDRLNENTIGGLVFTEEFATVENPKLTANIVSATYQIQVEFSDKMVENVTNYLSTNSITLQLNRKGEIVNQEVKPLIYDYKVSNSLVELKLACGNPNLRVDYLIKKINEQTGSKILITKSKKVCQYMNNGKNVEDFLESKKV